jgi:predicted hydrocarbon binding protein
MVTNMTDAELKLVIQDAAKEGAKQALKEIGLSDIHAYDDVKELRSLLETWKSTKQTIGHTIARVVTTAILTSLAVGIYMGWGEPR